jgi:hypothetical protein
MGYPSGKINTICNRHATMLLLLMVGFFMTTRGGANAFPIFCSDIKPYNESMLTGCDLKAGPLNMPYGSPRVIAPVEGASEAIEALVATATKNRALFHVGRVALSAGKGGKRDNGKPADVGDKQKAPEVAVDLHSSDAASGFLDQDEGWYYMRIDQDGTYLFFGDVPGMDDMMTNGDEDDFMPDGVGIGKRWRF